MTDESVPSKRRIERKARRAARGTRLSTRQAFVLAADKAGWSTTRIGRFIGRSNTTVERIREEIDQIRYEMDTTDERTKRLLDR